MSNRYTYDVWVKPTCSLCGKRAQWLYGWSALEEAVECDDKGLYCPPCFNKTYDIYSNLFPDWHIICNDEPFYEDSLEGIDLGTHPR